MFFAHLNQIFSDLNLLIKLFSFVCDKSNRAWHC